MNNDTQKPPPDENQQRPRPAETPILDVRDLLAGGREAILVHDGERYRLRVTAKDKLILTK
jgi:hemin uptake protein HemP